MAASVLTAPMASIGVPKEIKADEQRVALTPDAVRELISQGLEVRIEAGAGDGAGIADDAFAAAGADLVSREEAWGASCAVKKSVDCMLGLSSSIPHAAMNASAASILSASARYSAPLSLSSMKSRFHLVTRCREA